MLNKLIDSVFTTSISSEALRSGQPYLFREKGLPSMVNEIRLKKTVDWQALQLAATKTFIRYPYLSNRIQVVDGNFYLKRNLQKFQVAESKELRPLGAKATNEHLIDITYSETKIWITYHHGMVDGRGMKPFIEALLYNYFNEKNHVYVKANDIKNIGSRLKATEKEEPFKSIARKRPDLVLQAEESILKLAENHGEIAEKFSRFEFTFNQADYVKLAKENGATPAILMVILLSTAIQAARPANDQQIMANLAVDLREGTNTPDTFRNAVASVKLPFNSSEKQSFETLAKEYRSQVINFKQTKNLEAQVTKIAALSDQVDNMPNYEAKFKIGEMFEQLVVDTYAISYVGQYNLSDNEKYVESIVAYSSIQKGMTAQLIAAGKSMTFTMTQDFDTEDYALSLLQVIKECGLSVAYSGKIDFVTPRDEIDRKNHITKA